MARKSEAEATSLARKGDPYVTHTGEVIEEDVKPWERDANLPTTRATITPSNFKPSKRRTIQELPGGASTVNGVACVFMYTVCGLNDREIADALKITDNDVREVRKLSAYTECFDIVLSELLSNNSDLLQSRIAAMSHTALDTVIDIATRGKKEETRLTASRDILDRSGARPQDNVAKRSASLNELRIVVTNGDAKVDIQVNGEQV